MIGNLRIHAQALGVIGIETVNLASLLQSLLSHLLTGGKTPTCSRNPSYLHSERGSGISALP